MRAFSSNDIIKLLMELNERLRNENSHGEIYIFGGAIMAIEYHARLSTRDIDAVFEPKNGIYEIARAMAAEKDLDSDWLNDGVKGFLSAMGEHKVFASYSNLIVWSPSAEYLLAMKCLSARAERDFEDIKVLMKATGHLNHESVLRIVEKYYPVDRLTINTKYIIMAAENEIEQEGLNNDNKGNHP